MIRASAVRFLLWFTLTASLAASSAAQALGALALIPNLAGRIEQPLRYRPDGVDFVIENGPEFFNRPLYGGNTAFRVDAGDKPEFTLYLPGRGGNLRLGVQSAAGAKWLFEAAQVTTRYRPGAMLYEVRDPVLGAGGVLQVEVLALAATEGLVVRIEYVAGVADPGQPASTRPATREAGPTTAAGTSSLVASAATPIELVWAYGGVNGQRGARDGDIGTEKVPIGEYFQLKPEFCRSNAFTLAAGTFTLHSKPATILGLMPEGARLAVADATQWASCAGLLASAGWDGPPSAAGSSSGENAARTQGPALPVVVGRVALVAGQPRFLALQRIANGAPVAEELDVYREVTTDRAGRKRLPTTLPLLPAYRIEDLPRVFAEADRHFRELRERVTVETPDPFLNAAVAALNVAVDAVWDEPQGVVMHGAIAWRSRLLGWRGPYAQDELGWHDRARSHFAYWATRQNIDPVPAKLPPSDESANLSRSETALHSNGDLANSHYDMNLVYIDALFRHLLWTGDLKFARQVWPMIERHLAWERRLFRREFGPDKLPLYEAYAVIWASDDLQYEGGGVAHASAYNYYHNQMAARLAKLLGQDPTPYEREAELIAQAMRKYLWLPEEGMFAESKDLLGLQLVHPSAALWTFYHTLDSEMTTPFEAWQMTRYVDTQIPHLPVHGPGVPVDQPYAVLSTSNWMPYTWSTNNVVMGEIVHTALGYWQAGRPDEAYRLTKSALLASMFMGICPGNVGSMNYLDAYRRESQRDFGDGGGVTSRALIEGLFGIKPDALAGELLVRPGFPAGWDHASLRHPDFNFSFRREGDTDFFTIEPKFVKLLTLRFELPARRTHLASATVNGQPVTWQQREAVAGHPVIELASAAAAKYEVKLQWSGAPVTVPPSDNVGPGRPDRRSLGDPALQPNPARCEPVDLAPFFNDRVTEIFRMGKYRSPRSPFVSLAIPAQGIGAWAGHVNEMAEIDDTGLRAAAGANGGRLVLPDGVPFATPGPGDAKNILFTSQWDNYPHEATVPLSGRSAHAYLLMAGSTNHMQSRFDNGEVIVTYRDGTTARLALHNPTNWWPIDQDYFIDDFAFARPEPIPPRVDLKTGQVRLLDVTTFKGQGRAVPGGAATVLDLPLDPTKELQSLTVRTLANEVVIGLMSLTLER